MMRCPVCKNTAHTRTSRYLTNKTKESYYQCQNIRCSCTLKH
nr:ogr/Delta-like zinc finger family protein [Candidatus Arsenophonus triatominarum]